MGSLIVLCINSCATTKHQQASTHTTAKQPAASTHQSKTALLEAQINALNDSIKKVYDAGYEQGKADERDAAKYSPENTGIAKLDLSILSITGSSVNTRPLVTFARTNENLAQLRYEAGVLCNKDPDVLKKRLENPWALTQLWNAVKPHLKDILNAFGLTAKAKWYAKWLLPYFNDTAPKERLECFSALFVTYGKTSLSELEGSVEWTNATKKLKMDDRQMDDEYMAYLFAKRRYMGAEAHKKGEGKEEKQLIAQILTYTANL